MERKSVILLLGFILLINLASARLSISDTNQVYNLGDKIFITVEMVPASVTGNFEINVICNNQSLNVYRVPAEPSFVLAEQQKVTTYLALTPKNIGNISGVCFLQAQIGDEKIQSKTFTITDSVIVNAKLDKLEYDPGETISISVDATKANGQLLEGAVDIIGAFNMSKAVAKGQMIEKFAMPESSAPGSYTLDLFAYDKKDGEALNTGNTSVTFKINQIPKLLQISIDKTEINPGDSVTFGADLFDQSGQKMPANASVRITSPSGEEKISSINSGETGSYSFLFNDSAGTWKIFISALGINEERDVTLKEIQKASFEFVNGTAVLVVKNIGNAVYNKIINITIGNKTEQLSLLSIEIGEERRFSLSAPNGEYEVVVSDADVSIERKLLLTGNAISVSDFTGLGIFSKYPFVWLFIAVVLGALAVVFFIRFFRKKTSKHDSALDSEKIFPLKKARVQEKHFADVSGKVGEAESSIVAHGQRVKSAVMVVKLDGLTDNSRREMDKILSRARVRRGVIEWKDDFALVIFNPLITKNQANEWTAAKIGYEVYRDILAYNKGHSDKVNFGIGIHSGDLISAIENGKLKYTSVGGAIVFAKKIADFNSEKIVISEDARRNIMKDLRVQKLQDVGNKQTFEITGVTDREANAGKLDDLMKRMGK